MKKIAKRLKERGPEGMVFPGVPGICGLCKKSFLQLAAHQSTGACRWAAAKFRRLVEKDPPSRMPPPRARARAAASAAATVGAGSDDDEDEEEEEEGSKQSDDEGEGSSFASDEEDDRRNSKKRAAAEAGRKKSSVKVASVERSAKEHKKSKTTKRRSAEPAALEETKPGGRESQRAKREPVAARGAAGGNLPEQHGPADEEKKPPGLPADGHRMAKVEGGEIINAKGKGNDDSYSSTDGVSDELVELFLPVLCAFQKSRQGGSQARDEFMELVRECRACVLGKSKTPQQEEATAPIRGESRAGDELTREDLLTLLAYLQSPTPQQDGTQAPTVRGATSAHRVEGGSSSPPGASDAGRPVGDDFRGSPPSEAGRSDPKNAGWPPYGDRRVPPLDNSRHERSGEEWARSGNPGTAESHLVDRSDSGSKWHQNPSPPPEFHRPPPTDEYGRSTAWSRDGRYSHPSSHGHPRPNPVYNDRPELANGYRSPPSGYARGHDSHRQEHRPWDTQRPQPPGHRYENRHQRPEEGRAHFGSSSAAANGSPSPHVASGVDPSPRRNSANSESRFEPSDVAESCSRTPNEDGRSRLGRSSTQTIPCGDRQMENGGASSATAETGGRSSHAGSQGRGYSLGDEGPSHNSVAAKSPGNSPKEMDGEASDRPSVNQKAASTAKAAGAVAVHACLGGERFPLGIVPALSSVVTKDPKAPCIGQLKTCLESSNIATLPSVREVAEQRNGQGATTFRGAGMRSGTVPFCT
jgi:hypothetical protein